MTPKRPTGKSRTPGAAAARGNGHQAPDRVRGDTSEPMGDRAVCPVGTLFRSRALPRHPGLEPGSIGDRIAGGDERAVDFLKLPAAQILNCGMGIGYRGRGRPVNSFHTRRAELHEFRRLYGFD